MIRLIKLKNLKLKVIIRFLFKKKSLNFKILFLRLKTKFNDFFKPEYVRYYNIILPPKNRRLCGQNFKNDQYFLKSAISETNRLLKLGLNTKSRILDVGCGMWRLPIGIMQKIGRIKNYTGIDVNQESIRWCQKYLTLKNPNFHFFHINVKNLRYNPNGKNLNNEFLLPFKDEEFNIIYLYSVFSHMTIEDIKIYFTEFKRILDKAGKVFFTAYIEETVPEMTINPKNYLKEWSGQLHCVRYNKKFLNSIIKTYDFNVYQFEYGKETDGQSAYYLTLK